MDHPQLPDPDDVPTLLNAAVRQIEFARGYTLELLEATPQELWFEIPEGLPTHIAWQVGHLTVSQYGLLLFRVRGRKPEDLELIPGRFRKAYSRESVPSPDAESQPTAADLLARLRQVHDTAVAELRSVEPRSLLKPVDRPWAVWPVKLGAIQFCPLHEQIHAGQIGLVRRALGLNPVR